MRLSLFVARESGVLIKGQVIQVHGEFTPSCIHKHLRRFRWVYVLDPLCPSSSESAVSGAVACGGGGAASTITQCARR